MYGVVVCGGGKDRYVDVVEQSRQGSHGTDAHVRRAVAINAPLIVGGSDLSRYYASSLRPCHAKHL